MGSEMCIRDRHVQAAAGKAAAAEQLAAEARGVQRTLEKQLEAANKAVEAAEAEAQRLEEEVRTARDLKCCSYWRAIGGCPMGFARLHARVYGPYQAACEDRATLRHFQRNGARISSVLSLVCR